MRDPLLARLWPILQPGPVWVAGGYVRDRLLGRTSHDVDLIIPGRLREIKPLAERLASSLGVRAHILGRAPKAVWHIESPKLKIDLWPLGDGTLTSDAMRRDLTINALIMRLPEGTIIDPTGGIRDLQERRLRAVSCENLRSDPVRLLRIARFAAQLPEFSVDPNSVEWIAGLASHLGASPHERVGAELLLLLRGPASHRGLDLISRTGLAPYLFTEETGERNVTPAVYLLPAAHLMSSPQTHPIPGALREAGDAGRLGLLLFLFGMTAPACCRDYGWPKEVRRHALSTARLLPKALHLSREGAGDRRLFISRCGTAFPAVLSGAAAVAVTCGLPLQPWQRWWRQWRRNATVLLHPSLLLPASEAAAICGLPPGPELGRALQRLRDARILGRIRSRTAARAFLRSLRSQSISGPESDHS